MKICVVGAGAIGGILAGKLAAAGHAVSVVARGEHLAAIQRDGLTLKDSTGAQTLRVRASEHCHDLGAQQAVFITLKAYAIAPMLPRLKPLLAPDTAVVTAINGIPWWYFSREGGRFEGDRVECLDPDGAMLAALDAKHLVGCVVHAAAEVIAPGVVHHTGGRDFILGEIDGAMTQRLQTLAEAFEGAGLHAPLSPRIRDDIWTKLIGNTSYNPVAALTGALMNEINANPGLIELLRRMMIEGMQVAESHGARITVTLEERFGLARKLGAAKISMLQDLERGRALEIDAIVTAVCELGRKTGVPTPTIDGVEALIRERVRHLAAPVLIRRWTWTPPLFLAVLGSRDDDRTTLAWRAGCDKALHPAIGQRIGRGPASRVRSRRAAPALDSGPRRVRGIRAQERGRRRSLTIQRHRCVPKWSSDQPLEDGGFS
jgi:2-dehydropantoate 2-reductase